MTSDQPSSGHWAAPGSSTPGAQPVPHDRQSQQVPAYDGPPALFQPPYPQQGYPAPNSPYPQQGYPAQYPQQPYPHAPYGWQPAVLQRIAGLGLALRIVLGVLIVLLIADIAGWFHEYLLYGDLQRDITSVSADTGARADNFVNVVDLFRSLVFLVVVPIFLVWFYRARQNAQAYGSRPQRHSDGWAIGGWFCPIISLFYPYQMTTDVLLASEQPAGSGYGTKHSSGVVNAWWAAWIISNVLFLSAHFYFQNEGFVGPDELKTHAALSACTSASSAIAGLLLMLVIDRIGTLQAARQPGR